MTKGTTSRRGRTRPDTPKTIDLTASEVAPKPDEKAPEPVAMPAAAKESGQEAEPAHKGLSGFGATASVEPPAETKSGEPAEPEAKQAERKADSPEAPESPAKAAAAAGSAGAWGRGDAGAKSGAAPQAPAAKKSGGGLAAMFVSGLSGALIALFMLGGLSAAGLLRHVPLLGSLSPAETAQVPDLTADVAALDKRIATLEAEARAAPQGPDVSSLAADLDALSSRLAAAEEAVRQAQDGSASAGLSSRIDELSQRLAALESQPAASNGGAAASEVSALREQVDSLSAAVSATSDSVSETANAMSGRIDKLQTDIDGLKDEVAAAGEQGQVQADRDRAARTVAVDALGAAYRRGEPFSEFLDSLATLAGPSAAIEALKPFAATGVATDAQLIDGLDAASRQALDAVTPRGEGVMSRLLANARSLVDVRPAGPVEGDAPGAVLSRVEADLANGDFPAALAEWQFLPAEARQAASGWSNRLEARVVADKALREVSAGQAGK